MNLKKYLMLLLCVTGLSVQFTQAHRFSRTTALAHHAAAARAARTKLPVATAAKIEKPATQEPQPQVVQKLELQPQSLGQIFKESLVWGTGVTLARNLVDGIINTFKGDE